MGTHDFLLCVCILHLINVHSEMHNYDEWSCIWNGWCYLAIWHRMWILNFGCKIIKILLKHVSSFELSILNNFFKMLDLILEIIHHLKSIYFAFSELFEFFWTKLNWRKENRILTKLELTWNLNDRCSSGKSNEIKIGDYLTWTKPIIKFFVNAQ